MPEFNQPEYNQNQFNQGPAPVIYPPTPPTVTISTPLAPPGQQLTNYPTLINGGYKEAGALIFRNGILLTEGFDFTRNGGVVNFLVPPQPKDVLTAQVFSIGLQLGGNNPQRYVAPWGLPLTGKFDGSATFYSISFGPTINGLFDGKSNLITWGVSFQRVQIYRNGILQTWNQDYAAGPTAAVFYPNSIPQPLDLVTLLGYNNC